MREPGVPEQSGPPGILPEPKMSANGGGLGDRGGGGGSGVSERARGPGCYTDDEVEFMKAMDAFKRKHRKLNPDCRDILGVLYALGYRKVAESGKHVAGAGGGAHDR